MPGNDQTVLLQLMETYIASLKAEIQALRQASEDRHVEVMDLITKAFPEGDLQAHHNYHMRLIEEAAARKAIRLEVTKKLVSGSVWSGLVYLAYKLLELLRHFNGK